MVTTTDAFGNRIILSDATDGAVITTTDARGRTVTTTFHPDGGLLQSLKFITSTLPNGDQETLTSVAVIQPTAAGAGQSTEASRTTGGSASLVTGNAGVESRKVGREALALVAGAAGVAWLL